MERADIAIIGTGPAGVSAAITAKVRGKTVLLFGSRELSSKLTKAHKIQNYPGLPDIDGAQLAQAFKKHLDVLEIPITEKQVTAVYAMGGYFGIQTPDAMLASTLTCAPSTASPGTNLSGATASRNTNTPSTA